MASYSKVQEKNEKFDNLAKLYLSNENIFKYEWRILWVHNR